MEKVKITKVDVKESGMFVVGFIGGFNEIGEATGNIKWQKKECEYLEKSIGQIVTLETKQNGQYCNIVKVDMSKPISKEGKETYDKYVRGPITESEKIGNVPQSPVNVPKESEKIVEYADKKIDWRGENVLPITESEPIPTRPLVKGEEGYISPKANLMSQKDIMIISQCLTKAWAKTNEPVSPKAVLDAYRFFVLELEQNG